MGQEPEKAVRGCLLATELARALDLPDADVHDVYWTTLLQHVGCTAPAHEAARLFGDDLAVAMQVERTDPTSLRETLALLAATGRGTGARRARHLARTATAGRAGARAIARAVCEVGALMAERLRLGPGVRQGLLHNQERWDGRGDAPGLAGADVWAEVLAAEPEPARRIPPAGIDEVAHAFGDMVDLLTPFTLGHAATVAELAGQASARLGMPPTDTAQLRRAALLHDIGRVAVSGGVWERPGPLSAAQWEQVRLHPYHSERILVRSAALEPLARVAGMHHERHDGSGYHHRAAGAEIPAGARLLAAADAYQAMTQDRPHRPALAPEVAARELEAATGAGRFDPECARAVIEAPGQRPSRSRGAWPAGLSDREVEVLRLVAGGLSNRQIAATLVISPRTAEHHVQHVYTKIGVSTRAAAAMFAMQHGLLR